MICIKLFNQKTMTVTDYKNEIIAYFERKVKDMELNKDAYSGRGDYGIGYQYDVNRRALDNLRAFQGEINSGYQAQRVIFGIGPKLAQEIQVLIDSL